MVKKFSFDVLSAQGRGNNFTHKKRRMNMKKFLCLLLTLAMVLTLAACGGDKTPSKGDDSALSGTVVIYSTQTDVDHEVFLKIFNEAYPNVKVEFISGSLG